MVDVEQRVVPTAPPPRATTRRVVSAGEAAPIDARATSGLIAGSSVRSVRGGRVQRATILAPNARVARASDVPAEAQARRPQRSLPPAVRPGGSVDVIRRAVGDAAGITAGKASLGDFRGAGRGHMIGETKARLDESVNSTATLADMATRVETGQCRTAEEMLAAIAADTIPRYLARVGPKANFTNYGVFGRPNEFIFATEPADLAGLHPMAAMYKVGWEKSAIIGQADKAIAICILDTHAVVPDQADASKSAKVGIGKMEWPALKAKALADAAFMRSCTSAGVVDAGACFDVWHKTPVRGDPRTDDAALKIDCHRIRVFLNDLYGANALYSGMGATISENGQLGAREVMVANNGTGFKLTPANHVLIDTTPSSFTKAEAEAL